MAGSGWRSRRGVQLRGQRGQAKRGERVGYADEHIPGKRSLLAQDLPMGREPPSVRARRWSTRTPKTRPRLGAQR
jgi:hypothetical protein